MFGSHIICGVFISNVLDIGCWDGPKFGRNCRCRQVYGFSFDGSAKSVPTYDGLWFARVCSFYVIYSAAEEQLFNGFLAATVAEH